jgi:hypothetical protein
MSDVILKKDNRTLVIKSVSIGGGGGAVTPHAIGGDRHTESTLAELNAKVSDNDLIGTDDSRLDNDRVASGLRSATTVVNVAAAAAPSAGQILKATGSTAATWQDESGGGGTPGGSTTQVQFNDGGSFGGAVGVTWDKITSELSVGTIKVTNSLQSQGAGSNSFRAGFGAISNSQNSVAVGYLAKVDTGSNSSLSIGDNALVSTSAGRCLSIGNFAQVGNNANSSMAIGDRAAVAAFAGDSLSMGRQSSVTVLGSVAIGSLSKCQGGFNSLSLGYQAECINAPHGVAAGDNTLVQSIDGVALGANSYVIGTTTALAATGTMTIIVPGGGVPPFWDGHTITMGDGVLTRTFELDNGGGVTPGNIAVPFVTGDPWFVFANNLVIAFIGSGLNITAVDGGSSGGATGGNVIANYTNNTLGSAGNVPISSTGFSIPIEINYSGMAGGADAATGARGMAIGSQAGALNEETIAQGRFTLARAPFSICLGSRSEVLAAHDQAIALGRLAVSTAANRMTVGTVSGATTYDMELQLGKGLGVWRTPPPSSKPTVTGSKGGNAALASLLTALASYGLITDSTT